MVLCMLAARQESALEKTIDNTVIPCVVTDAYGLNQDNLHMATGFVDLLCGLRHERVTIRTNVSKTCGQRPASS